MTKMNHRRLKVPLLESRVRLGFGMSGSLVSALVMTALLGAGCGGDEAKDSRSPGSMLGANRTAAQRTRGGNEAPIIESVSLTPARPAPGRIVHASAAVSDADGDATELQFEWRTSVGRILGSGRSLNTTGFSEGERLELTVRATDGRDESEAFVEEFRLSEALPQIALVAIETDDGTKPGAALEAVVETTDEDQGGYGVLYEWRVSDRVVGRDDEFDTSALLPGDVVTLHAQLEFSDSRTDLARSQPIVIGRVVPPKIISKPEVGVEGGMFRYLVRATSTESGAKLKYELLEGPGGMTVDADSGVMSWRPSSEQRGAFSIEVAAKDQWGSGVAQSFEIRVAPPAPPASAR